MKRMLQQIVQRSGSSLSITDDGAFVILIHIYFLLVNSKHHSVSYHVFILLYRYIWYLTTAERSVIVANKGFSNN